MLTKAECRNGGGFNLEFLSEKIENKLLEISPLMLLQEWEGHSFVAATEVTNELSSLASSNDSAFSSWRDSWKKHMLDLVHAMAAADAGKGLESDTCIPALYNVLNPLYADRMETRKLSKVRFYRNHEFGDRQGQLC